MKSQFFIIIASLLTFALSKAENSFLQRKEIFQEEQRDDRIRHVHIVIGILTQPKSLSNNASFTYDQYVLEVNKKFIEVSGAIAVPIFFDSSDEDLYTALSQVNGVHFTGGGLTLIDPETGKQHPYYKTAKKIVEYSKKLKDEYDEIFPLTGFCQGFELLNLIASGDQKGLLKQISYVDVERKVQWFYDIDLIAFHSQIFASFETQILKKMASSDITFHYHSYGVTLEDYHNTPLKEFFKIISVDTYNNGTQNITYLTALEGYDYPIYALMYHPEYQMLDFVSESEFNIVKNADTKDIIRHISKFIYDQGKKNTHRFESYEDLDNLAFRKQTEEVYILQSGATVISSMAYGLQYNSEV